LVSLELVLPRFWGDPLLIEDVSIMVDRDHAAAHPTLRWKRGARNESA
jgi:hypothetical protein